MFQPKFDAHLDPKVKAKWLTALRSRKFKQGKGSLCNTDCGVATYCCLGVLAEVVGYAKPGDPAMDDSYITNAEATHLFHCDTYTADKLQAHLAVRNDGGTDWDNQKANGPIYEAPPKGLKFYHIARWIERNL